MNRVKKVLYFSAEWCPPCQEYGPLVYSTTADLGIEVQSLDMSTPEDIDVALHYDIRTIPTLIRDYDAEALVGAKNEGELRDWLA